MTTKEELRQALSLLDSSELAIVLKLIEGNYSDSFLPMINAAKAFLTTTMVTFFELYADADINLRNNALSRHEILRRSIALVNPGYMSWKSAKPMVILIIEKLAEHFPDTNTELLRKIAEQPEKYLVQTQPE